MQKSQTTPRWWDWTSIVLLFLLLQALATRLVNTSWTPYLYLTQLFATEALAIGLSLGYSQFSRGAARWLSFFYMVIMLPLQWTLIMDQEISLEEQLTSVWGRLYVSVSELILRHPVDDAIFFVAVMSIAVWLISSAAGFALTRQQNYLKVVLPAAIGILVIQHYDNAIAKHIWGLGVFIFLAIVLLGRMHYLQNKASWQSRRVFLSAENSWDLAGSMAALATLIIIVSFMVPPSLSDIESVRKTWNRWTQPWHDFTDSLENAVSAVDSPSGGRPGEFYGTELQLGRGFPLSEAVMFEVKVPDLPAAEHPPRYYWRGRTYDFFNGDQWYITGTTREEFSPRGNGPAIPNTAERDPKAFSFEVGESRFSLLYGPSQPVWFSRPGSYLAAPASTAPVSTEAVSGEKDIVSWNASPSLLPGEVYEVQSVVKNPNTTELREAGTTYPDWVVKKYLQIPQGFSPRITELAQELTANTDNPYDAAMAITRYLRDNIEYSATIPAVPRNRDPLEWIIFDYKKAYCVYYATSEALMLRSIGIPARVAVGFAQGSPTERSTGIEGQVATLSDSYTIRKKDAHAWPEVYFPGVGWVEFEPTSSQAALSRPAAPDPNAVGIIPPVTNADSRERPLDEALDQGLQEESAASTGNRINPAVYLTPLFVVLAALTVFLARRYNLPERAPVFVRASFDRAGIRVPDWIQRWENWVLLSPIARDFESINFSLRLLKQPAPMYSTPAERAESLSKLLPPLAEPIKILLDEHQTSLYTSRTADAIRARRSAITIRTQAIIARARHFLTGEYVISS
jgi:transglutaminase-like putative cysteine protease